MVYSQACGRWLKQPQTALVKIREAAWWETDAAIKHPSFTLIWLPTADVRFTKMVSRSKGGKMFGETANVDLETDERREKKNTTVSEGATGEQEEPLSHWPIPCYQGQVRS